MYGILLCTGENDLGLNLDFFPAFAACFSRLNSCSSGSHRRSPGFPYNGGDWS
uniref:Uncharacterized protein n=1 Tax=Ciona intestinalis TaxID=7719 RepID=H2XL59_CIOIN